MLLPTIKYITYLNNKLMGILEDAYNSLVKIKDSKDNKVVKKSNFHELNKQEKPTRETK